jgi:hypothetical protein
MFYIQLVITTVVQSFLTTDAHILSIDRKVRLVASVFLVVLAFLPVPIVLLVLLLKAMSPGGLDKEEPLAEGDEDPEAAADEAREKRARNENGVGVGGADLVGVDGKPLATNAEEGSKDDSQKGLTKEKKITPDGRPYFKGEPKTGFGPTPVGKREILETAMVIIIPGILLTFEQCVRCTQAFHTPKPGAKTPWVSIISSNESRKLTPFLTVYDQTRFLDVHLYCGAHLGGHLWPCRLTEEV